MSEPSSSLLSKLAAAWPPERWQHVTVLVAVSGGADSVALVWGLNQLRTSSERKLIVAHFNHRLRGAESDADQSFVQDLAEELGLRFVTAAAESDLAGQRGGRGLEGAAREARYEFLARAADEAGARYVATAHTADDQVETMLHNLVRGTGLAGLAGIPRARQLTEAAVLIRPLLNVTRKEVIEYLRELGKPYRQDATNSELHFTRNRIRHKLLPLLENEFNPDVRGALLRLREIADRADEYLRQAAGHEASRVTQEIPGGIQVHLKFLRQGDADILLIYALRGLWERQGWPLQDMSAEKWEQLLVLARESSLENKSQRAVMFPGGVKAEIDEGFLRLTLGHGGGSLTRRHGGTEE
jgi:tRNA(Ile)-lysidine synthase